MTMIFSWYLTISLLLGFAFAISDEQAAELGYPAGVDVWYVSVYLYKVSTLLTWISGVEKRTEQRE